MRKSVTILSSEMDGTPLIRDHALARMLSTRFDVHVVGFCESGSVWPPLASQTQMDFRPIEGRGIFSLWRNLDRIDAIVEGDVLYAMKPKGTSFGLARELGRRRGLPVVVDVDDWEMGFFGESWWWDMRLGGPRWFTDPRSSLYTRWLDRHVARADAVTVTTAFLQNRYGGHWIPHTRDPSIFHPRVEPVAGIETGALRVLFLGTARIHKGLAVLVEAWRRADLPDARLHIVGTPTDSADLPALDGPLRESISIEGVVPFDRVPATLAAADVVVVPQLDMRASRGQLPTKLVEAMAMGKAIVASRVGDIVPCLGDAGLLVPAGDAPALAAALRRLSEDPELRRRLGERARERFLDVGSADAVAPRLCDVFDAILNGREPWPDPAWSPVPSAVD